MPLTEQIYRWELDLVSPPEALWPLVSDTDRFNRDCGYPPVTVVPPPKNPGSAPPATARANTAAGGADPGPALRNVKRLRANVAGISVEWDEHPFEWMAPRRFAVDRTYHSGPVARMLTTCELRPSKAGGTHLVYELRITPSGLLGRLTLPYAIGRQARRKTEVVFRKYDQYAQAGLRRSEIAQRPNLAPGGAARVDRVGAALIAGAGQPKRAVDRLGGFLTAADDLSAARMRPYALADQWNDDRRETLKLFLHATRSGLLDFSWDLICPHCRGAQAPQGSLNTLSATAHCPSCDVDFTANFDQSVELTFRPNPSVREVVRADYCVGGPQITPHVIAQQELAPGVERTLPLALRAGRYRLRSPGLSQQYAFRVDEKGAARARLDLGATPLGEPAVAPDGELVVANASGEPRLAIVEHVAWSDQAVTAAEVTSLQLFRDLFSREILRPGEQISVGSMTVVFTDLKNSTRMYKDVGDASAFGRVLTHFEILKACVADEGGCLVKTMGDAILAVFTRPAPAVRAMDRAQRWLAHPRSYPLPAGINAPPSSLQPLSLKAGIHLGPCLAISQNDRLDYFGTTVNFGARLCALCTGKDIILSEAARGDAEVTAWLRDEAARLNPIREETRLRGFGDEAFQVWRLARLEDIGGSAPPV